MFLSALDEITFARSRANDSLVVLITDVSGVASLQAERPHAFELISTGHNCLKRDLFTFALVHVVADS